MATALGLLMNASMCILYVFHFKYCDFKTENDNVSDISMNSLNHQKMLTCLMVSPKGPFELHP